MEIFTLLRKNYPQKVAFAAMRLFCSPTVLTFSDFKSLIFWAFVNRATTFTSAIILDFEEVAHAALSSNNRPIYSHGATK